MDNTSQCMVKPFVSAHCQSWPLFNLLCKRYQNNTYSRSKVLQIVPLRYWRNKKSLPIVNMFFLFLLVLFTVITDNVYAGKKCY